METPREQKTSIPDTSQEQINSEYQKYICCLEKIQEALTEEEWETFTSGLKKYHTALVIENLEQK